MRYKKRFREKRRIPLLKKKWFWRAILLLILFSGIFYLVFISSAFEIKEIKIAGIESCSEAQIKEAIRSEIEVSKNIFLIDIEKAVSNAKSSVPKISGLKVKRVLFNTILIQTEERKPIFVFQGFYIDNEGVVFEKASSALTEIRADFKTAPVLGSEAISRNDISRAVEIKDEFDRLKIELSAIFFLDQRIEVIPKGSWRVYFKREGDIKNDLKRIRILLEEKYSPKERENIEYIDLRFEKIYISLKNPAEE